MGGVFLESLVSDLVETEDALEHKKDMFYLSSDFGFGFVLPPLLFSQLPERRTPVFGQFRDDLSTFFHYYLPGERVSEKETKIA
jgi:hypothetical protein